MVTVLLDGNGHLRDFAAVPYGDSAVPIPPETVFRAAGLDMTQFTETAPENLPIRPFDFTSGAFKFGDSPADVYRTFNTGLTGTPMPSFFDTILYPREAFPDLNAWRQLINGKPAFNEAEIKELAD